MTSFISIICYSLVLTPLVSAVLIYTLSKKRERLSSQIATVSIWLIMAETLLCLSMVAQLRFVPQDVFITHLKLGGGTQFYLRFLLDFQACVLLSMTSFLGSLIVKYSRYYLHREEGYARFFATIFLFIAGMNLLSLAGNLELLFGAWEIVGISSFLLIGFYRNRTLPVRNALRTYYIYRVCDAGLLLSVWLSHLLFHSNLRFIDLDSQVQGLNGSSGLLIAISFLLLFSACGKSAQFPFCFWLPRAMEGPTPSSAIFYGGLSIHAGIFLLLRTGPIWYHVPSVRMAMTIVGILSASIATLSGRIQANIKGQIAYSSIAQVGLMMIELSLGLTHLALFHFVANACLRTYQLLISPSVVSHLLRVHSMSRPGFRISDWSFERMIPPRLRSSLYAIALSEGYLEPLLHRFLWTPLFYVSEFLHWVAPPTRQPFILLGIFSASFALMQLPALFFTALLTLISFIVSIFVFSEQSSPFSVWHGVTLSSLLLAVAIWGKMGMEPNSWIYLSGILPSWFLGYRAIKAILSSNSHSDLRHFHGRVQRKPHASLVLFLCFISLAGFPLTPTFFGEELLLVRAPEGHVWIPVAIACIFALQGITLSRLFASLCLGPEPKS